MLTFRDRCALLAGLIGLAGFAAKADAVAYTFSYTFSDSATGWIDSGTAAGLQVIGGFEGTANGDGTITGLSGAWFEVAGGPRRENLDVFQWSDVDGFVPGGIASALLAKVNFKFVDPVGLWGFRLDPAQSFGLGIQAFDYAWPGFSGVMDVYEIGDSGTWTLTASSSVPDSASTLFLSACGLGLLAACRRRRVGSSV